MARRIVAFLDVLGFKALVETAPQEKLLTIYGRLQEAARDWTTSPVFPDDHRRFDGDAYYAPDEISHRRVANVVMASDSIVVYSAGDTDRDALAVLAAVRGMLLAGYRDGIALRGAVAIGELDELDIEDEASTIGWNARFFGLVGLGLVRAYELEGLTAWSGAILHPELVEHLEALTLAEFEEGAFTVLDQMCATRMLVETEAPLKRPRADDGSSITHEKWWVIDWPMLTNHIDWNVSEREVAAAFTSFDREADERKRDETIAFMRRAADDANATSEGRALRRRA
jgi:hypothetical protein